MGMTIELKNITCCVLIKWGKTHINTYNENRKLFKDKETELGGLVFFYTEYILYRLIL